MAETPKWPKMPFQAKMENMECPKCAQKKVKDDMYSIMRSVILKETDKIFF